MHIVSRWRHVSVSCNEQRLQRGKGLGWAKWCVFFFIAHVLTIS